MNKLPLAKRTQILAMLCEGSAMRSISRITDVSISTVSKLFVEAGNACLAIHDEMVRNVKASRVQCDEIWSFCYAKEKQAKLLKDKPEGAGDVWTWTALDADTKLIVSFYVGDRSGASAIELMDDLRDRLANRVQLTTDGHRAYLEAVEGAFGADVDYAQLVKLYGPTITRRAATALPSALALRSFALKAIRKLRTFRPATSSVRTSICGWGCAASHG